MKRILSVLKSVLIKMAGFAGGLLVGTFLAIGYLIAWRSYHAVLPSLGLSVAIIYLLSLVAGVLLSRFFAYFVLVPLCWLLSGGSGGEALGEGKEEVLPFVANVLYFVAIPLMVFGGIFSLGYIYGIGFVALCGFGAILCRTELRAKIVNS